ncbi:hypothetical protein [Corynebacterium casei]|uniref:hypothetical protein n=1 Tax=Corynebacterium casei TaxID=160386 RepID=UPI003F8F932A
MRKKIASIVMACALAFGAAAPAPAFAQNANEPGRTDNLDSTGGLIDNEMFGHLALIFGIPYMLSSMGSSLIGIEQCGLHDTRGCDDI